MKDSEVIAALAKSKASANRIAKSLEHKMIKAAINNLQTALKTLEAREAAKESKRRESNIKKLAAMMKEMGLSPADIGGKAPGKAKKKPAAKTKAKTKTRAKKKAGPRKGTKVAPKYQIVADGKKVKWTGRGRMPVVFREFVEKGGSLEQCLI